MATHSQLRLGDWTSMTIGKAVYPRLGQGRVGCSGHAQPPALGAGLSAIRGGRTYLHLALQLSILLPQGSCLRSSLLTCLQQGSHMNKCQPCMAS